MHRKLARDFHCQVTGLLDQAIGEQVDGKAGDKKREAVLDHGMNEQKGVEAYTPKV